jgi:phage tail-like protein
MKNIVKSNVDRMVMFALSALVISITFMLAVDATVANPSKIVKQDLRKIGWFRLELQGVAIGNFLEVDGIESKTDIIEYQQGGELGTHKVPGKTRYSNIRLRREFLSADLWQWRKKAVQGGADDIRKSGSIIFVAQNGTELARYNFFNAWPAGWKAGKTNDMHMFEEIELAVEAWEKQYP